MSLKQTYTIFRTEEMKKRGPNGLVPHTHISMYPGYGRTPQVALDEVMDDTAINESDLLSEMPESDPDYDMELRRAVEWLSGKWSVFSGEHKSPPKGTSPLLTV